MGSILLISAPGAGKSECAKYIEKKYNYVHMSIGNLLREKFINDDSLNEYINNGKFADNEIVYKIFNNFVKNNSKSNFIFDGFPRLIEQIEPFESILNSYNIKLDKIIYINIDKEIAIKRISGRLICKNCNEIYNKYYDNLDNLKCRKCNGLLYTREDDKLSVYENRYQLFINKTVPIIEYFKNNYSFYEISNNGSIDELYNQIDIVMKRDGKNDNN